MKRYQTRVPGSIPKARIDHFLAEWLPQALNKPLTKTMIRALILSGSVYINRHRNKNATTPVFTGAIIEVYYDEDRLLQNQPSRMVDVRFEAENILYEDEWLIVVNKPSGLPTQPTLDPNRPNLFELMKKLLNEREHVLDAYVGLHHRLDKDTSGIVLFTKKESANKGVSELFLKHEIQKSYQVLAWRGPHSRECSVNENFTIQNHLGRVSEVKGKSKYGEVRSGGDVAITHFRTIEAFRDVYWFEAKPQTGRTHQIRVHCSELGLPILGDELYFPEGVACFINPPRLMLHAGKLEFKHPITQVPVLVEAQIPAEFVQLFGQLKA